MRDLRFLLKTHYENSRALIIGINSYRFAPPLSYAVNDAVEVGQVLMQTLGFPEDNVTLLLDGDATRDNILKAFLRFTRDDVGLDERIVVFFAGHGHTQRGFRGEIGFLVPCDGDVSDLSSLIRWSELTQNAELIRAKHMLFVMDACYGGLALTRGLHAGSTRFLKDMMLRYSRQVLTAGKADEVVSDGGGPLPDHSVFTGHFLEGLRGNAVGADGTMTAAGLMSYVYSKVASDTNSHQTPHYGHFDGDGDLMLLAPGLDELEESKEKDLDRLVVVPYPEEPVVPQSTEEKIRAVKSLLAEEDQSIALHDFLMDEVREFLSKTGEDNFAVAGGYSQDELLERISRYESATEHLSILLACLAYWAKPTHSALLQKSFARMVDRLDSRGGLVNWLNLRWYPIIQCLYTAGIAAVNNRRYDSLATIFYAQIRDADYRDGSQALVEGVSNGLLELTRADAFKQVPGHERHYVPISEYLFKKLQPILDDALYLGGSYEQNFDEFEVLFALAVADIRKSRESDVWGPIGRFGWKQQRNGGGPLGRVVQEARAGGANWLPVRSGLFGGDIQRFLAVAEEFQQRIGRLGW